MNTAEKFFNELFSDAEGTINIRTISGAGKLLGNSFIPLGGLDPAALLQRHNGNNLFFGVNPRRDGDGSKQGVLSLVSLYCDIDFKETPESTAMKRLDEFPLRPSALIRSGGGFHVYWFMREPLDPSEMSRFENVLKRLCVALDGDSAAAEAARVLRFPGSLNLKYDPPRPVEITQLNPDARFNLSDFDFLPELSQASGRTTGKPPDWQETMLQGVIKGQRKTTAAQLAGRYVSRGLSDEEIFLILSPWNSRNVPPLTDRELRDTIHGIRNTDARNHPGGDGEGVPFDVIKEHLAQGESGIAKLIAQEWRDRVRYDTRGGRWFRWGGHHWHKMTDERALEIFESLRETLEKQARRFAEEKIKHAATDPVSSSIAKNREKTLLDGLKVIGDVSRRCEILKLCRSEGSFLGYDGEWDEQPLLVACPNGILDLESLVRRDGSPNDNIRTVIPTPWEGIEAACPLWEKTLLEIFDDNEEIVEYVQRVFGYGLTGLNNFHHLWIWEGAGRNGKGLIARTLANVLGGYVGFVDRELLLERKNHRQSGAAAPDILALRGRRLAIMSETAENRKFDAGRLKWLTGGDDATARGLYEKDTTTFKMRAKLHLQTNFKPHISGGDFASWQRIVLLPFDVAFVPRPSADPAARQRQADPFLEEKLKAEASGILSWLVQGFVAFRQQGLNPPDCIRDVTREYQKEEDTVGRFLDERTERHFGSELTGKACYAAFVEWCEGEKLYPKSQRSFGREIRHHVQSEKRRDGVVYIGIKLRV